MINFQSIEFKNLLSTGNNPVNINFLDSKTTIITGKNGCGKCVHKSTDIEIDIEDDKIREKFISFIS